MAQHHAPSAPDPKQIADSEATWHSFTQAIKYSLIGIAVIVAGLALAFTDI